MDLWKDIQEINNILNQYSQLGFIDRKKAISKIRELRVTNKDIQTAVTAALRMNAIPFSQAGDRQLAEELESYKAILVENYIRSIQESLYSNS